ncbi:MAG: hypothetical protein H0U49_05620 [Parachlamydiaceae bacterium]|nr:hypothetical protein [Parachlamydiaceae bacterium]
MFDVLLEKLFTVDFKKEVDEVILKQCYRLLKDVDLECLQESKFMHALKWLSAAEKNNSDAYVDETLYLLKMLLQKMGSDFSTEVAIVEVSKHLLKSLKPIVLKKQSIPNDLKQLIISSHSKITQILQTTAYLEIFCEYLNALHHYQLSIKITHILLPQAIWIASEYLKKEVYDPAKLQEIHKLLNNFLQGSPSSEINSNISCSLATALLAHKLPVLAMREIEKAVISSSDKGLSLPLVTWCETLLEQNEPQLCLIPLKVIKGLHIQSSLVAELYLRTSKMLLDKHFEISVHLILDNWNLLQTHCISHGLLIVHLKTMIRNIFTSTQEIDVLFLFSSLMDISKSHDVLFMREQLKNCCAYIDKPPKNTHPKEHAARVVEIITSVFFKTTSIEAESFSHKWKIYHAIKTLVESQKRELIFLGIKQLNFQYQELFSILFIEHPKIWVALSQKAISNSFLTCIDYSMSTSESSEVKLLIQYHAMIIYLCPAINHPNHEKELSLFLLKNSLYQNAEDVEFAIDHFLIMLKKYHVDSVWVEIGMSLAIDSLIKMSALSNDYLVHLSIYKKLTVNFGELKSDKFNTFLTRFVEKCLHYDFLDSRIRSLILFQTGIALEGLLNHYKIINKKEIIFHDNGSINPIYQKEITEIIDLVDRYLFCLPIQNYEFIITLDPVNNEIEETTYDLTKGSKFTCKRRLFNQKEKDVFNPEIKTFKEGEKKDGIGRCFPITKVYFTNNFIELVKILEDLDYSKAYPKLSLIFHLVASDELKIALVDAPIHLSEKSKRENKLLQFQMVYDSIITTLNRLIILKDFFSSEKALSIIQNIPQCLWEIYLDEFTDLLMMTLSNKQLYPNQIVPISRLFNELLERNKCTSNWISTSTKLCFHVLETLNSCLNIDDGMKLSQKPSEFLYCVFFFFNDSLRQGLIEKDHPGFMYYFKAQLRRMVALNSMRAERTSIACFVEASLDRNPNYEAEIFELISQNYQHIILLEPEVFEHNINISIMLSTKKFFKTRLNLHGNTLRKLLQHFDFRLNNDPPQELHYYSKHLTALFSQIYICPNEKVQGTLRLKLHSIVRNHIDKFLTKIDSPKILEKNIENLILLIQVKYFDDSTESLKQLEIYKQTIANTFQIFCIQKTVTNKLCLAIRKLLSEEEVMRFFTMAELFNLPQVENSKTDLP